MFIQRLLRRVAPATTALALLLGAPPPPPAAAADTDPRVYGAQLFKGRAFDTCETPSLRTMRAWATSSPYGAVGVYYAGRGRGCRTQPHLDRSWMRQVHAMGWRVLPIYVGSQSPCVTSKHKRDVRIGDHPARQGRTEARHAVRRARNLGMVKRSPLFLDMEHFEEGEEGKGQRKCVERTLAFVRAWNLEVRRLGWFPGFYSSANSGVRMMEQARLEGLKGMPSVMWFARWRTRPSLYGEPQLSPFGWHPHRRIHQYAGMVKERHGGRRLLIDRNVVDAPAAILRPGT